MNRINVLLVMCALITGGCSESETSSVKASENTATSSTATVSPDHGAWLGVGTFRATEGTQQIKAQLELLANGTYRFMVIEPRVLMLLVGLEKGKWQRTGKQLNLNPFPDQTSKDTGKPGILNKAPKNFRPKSLSIQGDTFLLKDEQMDLQFEPNPKATEKLRKSGEI